MKVLVVDDEAPARERLVALLGEMEDYELCGTAGNGREALAAVSENRPDIVLLDIRMPGMDGIETAHHLNRLEQAPAIVFTTAYDEYAIEAFDARAIGYVLKPVRARKLAGALAQVARLVTATLEEAADAAGLTSKRKHVCCNARDKITLVPVDTINFFRADQKYTAVHHDDGISLIDDSLKALEQEFADEFVRIHRAALVAVRRIDSIRKTSDGKLRAVLRDGSHTDDKELIISRRHVAEVRRRLKGG